MRMTIKALAGTVAFLILLPSTASAVENTDRPTFDYVPIGPFENTLVSPPTQGNLEDPRFAYNPVTKMAAWNWFAVPTCPWEGYLHSYIRPLDKNRGTIPGHEAWTSNNTGWWSSWCDNFEIGGPSRNLEWERNYGAGGSVVPDEAAFLQFRAFVDAPGDSKDKTIFESIAPLYETPPKGQTFGRKGIDSINPTGELGDPVNTATGSFVTEATDLSLPGPGIPLRWTRAYNSADTKTGPLGKGWTHSYNASLDLGTGSATLRSENGQQTVFKQKADGSFTAPASALSKLAPITGQVNYRTEVLAEDPVAYWRLGESSGTTASDETAHHIDGVYKNAPSLNASGPITGGNGAVSLDGVNDYIEVPDTPSLTPGSSYTLEAWVKWTNDGRSWHTIATKGNGLEETYAALIFRDHDGRWAGVHHVTTAGGVRTWFNSTSNSLPSGDGWHHVAITYDGAMLRTFIDGVLNEWRAKTGSLVATSTPLRLGLRHDASLYLKGALDDVAFYERALTGADLIRHVQAATGIGTVGYEVTRRDGSRLRFNLKGKLTSITDKNGLTNTLAYSNGKLTSVTDSAGRTVLVGHNADGLIDSVTMPDGRKVTYAYAAGKLTSVTDVRGGTVQYTYDLEGRLEKIIDQNSHTVLHNKYGTTGRVIEQLDAHGRSTYFAWDSRDQIATMTDARGKEWKDDYYNNVLTRRIDPMGNVTEFERSPRMDLTAIVDPRGNKTTMTYDGSHNLLTRKAPAPLSYLETFTYDAQNNIKTYTNGRQKTTTFDYDAVGNLTKITRPGLLITDLHYNPATKLLSSIEDPRDKITQLGYDGDGNLNSVVSPMGRTTTFTHDTAGRVTSVVEPRGNESGALPDNFRTTYGYDAANHLTSVTSPLGQVSEWKYDPAGNLEWSEDANNHRTQYQYDLANRLQKVIAPDLSQTSYVYDNTGNLVARTDAELHTTNYEYTDAGQLKKAIYPTNKVWTYAYDPAGNLKEIIDAAGNATAAENDGKTTLSYDELNKLKTIDYSDGTPDVAFGYDANGNRTSISDGAGSETYVYDDLDRLTSISRGSDTFAYQYDSLGQVTRRTYPDSTIVDYAYDDDALLDTVTSDGKTTNYDYDRAGRLTTTTLPSSNGFVESRVYDRAGQLSEIKNAKGTDVMSKATYTYDPAGNPLTMTTLDGTTSYGYDLLDRLTRVCVAPACDEPTDSATIGYTYDDVGNRLTETRSGGPSTSYEYDAADRILSSTTGGSTSSYAHDANGNMTQSGGKTFTYDVANRMVSATASSQTTTYSYSGDGRRLQASTGSAASDKTNFLWDPNWQLPQLARESDGAGNLIRRYVTGTDTISMSNPTSTNYFHYNGIGSVTDVTNASGAEQWSYAYEPFGAEMEATQVDPNAIANPVRFTGEYLDPTDLYHLRARQYDSRLGRFGAMDPLMPPLTDGYSAPYLYVQNRPTMFVDPSGMVCFIGKNPDGSCRGHWVTDAGRSAANTIPTAVGIGAATVGGGDCGVRKDLVVVCTGTAPGVTPGAGAMTVGNTVIIDSDVGVTPELVRHEVGHTTQYLIPGFVVWYGISYKLQDGCSVFDRWAGYEGTVYEDRCLGDSRSS